MKISPLWHHKVHNLFTCTPCFPLLPNITVLAVLANICTGGCKHRVVYGRSSVWIDSCMACSKLNGVECWARACDICLLQVKCPTTKCWTLWRRAPASSWASTATVSVASWRCSERGWPYVCPTAWLWWCPRQTETLCWWSKVSSCTRCPLDKWHTGDDANHVWCHEDPLIPLLQFFPLEHLVMKHSLLSMP